MKSHLKLLSILAVIAYTFVGLGSANAQLQWTVVSPSPTSYNLNSVTYGNGQYVAVGDNGTVLTSPDGIAWTSQVSGTSNNLISVIYGNGKYVAVVVSQYKQNNGMSFTWWVPTLSSPNGITWTGDTAYILITPNGSLGNGTVAYCNGQYVIVSKFVPSYPGGMVLTSSDGSTWNLCTSGPFSFNFVTFGNSQYVAVGSNNVDGFGSTTINTSSNCTSWSADTSGVGNINTLNYVTYGNGQFVAVGVNGTVLTSSSGTTWTNQASGTSNNLSSATYGSSQYVIVGSTGTILNSPDVINWRLDTSGTINNLNSVATDSNGRFVAVGNNGTIVVTSGGGTILSAPVLVSPDSAAQNQPNTLSLIWNKVSTATSYDVQVATSSFFSSLVMEDTASTDTIKVLSGLTAGGTTYYWRVRAKNGSGGSPWANRKFTTIVFPPATPVLVSPANGAVAQPVSLSLVWNKVNTATSYYVQVATDTGFTSIFTQDSTLTDSLKSISGLSNSAVYYWRVRAKNTGGTSNWTSRWSFTTIIAAAATPTLVSPATGIIGEPISLSLIWNKVSTATSYYFQVATDTGFTSIFKQDSTLTDTLKSDSGFAFSTLYYWRVRAKNAGGVSAWSEVRNFTTMATGVLSSRSSIPHAFSITGFSGMVRYGLPVQCHVSLKYYDLRGRLIASLVNSTQAPGYYALSVRNAIPSNGSYIRIFEAGTFVKRELVTMVGK